MISLSRRAFTNSLLAASGVWMFADGKAPSLITSEATRPTTPSGIASGDITATSAVLWSRTDRPGRMHVEYATVESFRDAKRAAPVDALEVGDFTAKLQLTDLPSGERIFYRVTFEDLTDSKVRSLPLTGSFRTAPLKSADVLFAWSGDTAGQGYGINLDFGGMKIYETMRRLRPDFFLHSGDMIYADNPLPREIRLPEGKVWKNVVTEAKSKVAETLDEFRGAFAYNLLDENVRRFNADVPLYVQWDDHETLNNWYPGKVLDDPRYTEKNCSLLAARAKRAFFEFNPIGDSLRAPQQIYRSFPYGPSLELFLLDQRSYRGPNTLNRQKEMSETTAFMGPQQIAWLKERLLQSKATWKVMASDMPLGLIIGDAGGKFEGVANGPGPALGRELEIADLLKFLKTNKIRNVIWLTADVHYAAAHYYDPAKAQFTEFDPFWEFVAGPLNAGSYGPGTLDDTFGPQVKYQSAKRGDRPGEGPMGGRQYFGTVQIEAKSEALTTTIYDLAGKQLYQVTLPPSK